MKLSSSRPHLHKLPLALAVIFILFISLFALDVFSEGYTFPELLVALFMHLIPSFVLALLTFFAVKNPKLGGLLFIIISIIFTLAFNTYRQTASLLLISLPPMVIGVLFYVTSLHNSSHH